MKSLSILIPVFNEEESLLALFGELKNHFENNSAIEVIFINDQYQGIILGDSLLMKLFTAIIFPDLSEGYDVLLHPIAFAGWIGLLVTMLNLLPIGQLDGGHIIYALFGDKYKLFFKLFFIF